MAEMTNEDRAADVLHNVRIGIRYHMYREGFFNNCHRLTGVLSLLAGSAAFSVFLQGSAFLGAIAGGVVAVAQAIDLLFDMRARANIHQSLRRSYVLLEPELTAVSAMDPDTYQQFKRRIATIEIKEPPLHQTLVSFCQNQAAIVSGYTKEDSPKAFTNLIWFKQKWPNLF